MIQLDDAREKLLKTTGHILVLGGPGSGKTTIALCKAKELTRELKSNQKILFLSFARATVMRVVDKAKEIISDEDLSLIKISTYHAFEWEVIKSNAKFLSKHPIRILLPHDATARFPGIKGKELIEISDALFTTEGRLHFDLFAKKTNELLSTSEPLLQLLCDVYPIIILDEFQDTNEDEWSLIQQLGQYSTLIALADPEQRIYDFRGASPVRIQNFMQSFEPNLFDFGKENNRSNGTDIVQFGNDLLLNCNKQHKYKDVHIYTYREGYSETDRHSALKGCVLREINSLQNKSNQWSIAILTPSNNLMIDVSNYLYAKQRFSNGRSFPIVNHEIMIDMNGVYWAAMFIADILDYGSQNLYTIEALINNLISHIRGRNNKGITQTDTKTCDTLNKYLTKGKSRLGKKQLVLIEECESLLNSIISFYFSGNITKDWSNIQKLFQHFQSTCLQNVFKDSKYIHLFRQGSNLYSALDSIWRSNSTYVGARAAVENAITQEHFAMDNQKVSGVNVMTIHKSKGKEFDIVIVYEGVHSGRIVNDIDNIEKARLALRVAVTRARKKALILTPNNAPCALLI